ncbi:MAG: pilus assembly protein PilM [Planctomycetota bacterium]|nr:pilus assembly protein PilM [Planctomycetota bacterium]
MRLRLRSCWSSNRRNPQRPFSRRTLTDYQILNLPTGMPGKTALVGTVRAESLDEDSRLLTQAKVPMSGIVPKNIALHTMLADSGILHESETTMLLDVGAETTEIVLTQGRNLILARSSDVGGSNFTDAVARQFNVIPEVAEEIKLAEGAIMVSGRRPSRMSEFREGFDELVAAEGIRFRNDPSYPQKLSRSLAQAAGRLRVACDAALRFATVQTKMRNLKIDRILLSGAAAKLPGLLEYFQRNFKVTCEYWDSLSMFDQGNVAPDNRDVPSEYTNVLALAYIPAADKGNIINLVPQSVKNKMRFWDTDVYAYIAAILIVVGVLLWWMGTNGRAKAVDNLSGKVNDAMTEARSKANRLSNLEDSIQLQNKRISLLSKQTYFNPMVLKFIQTVREQMPETITLTVLEFEPFIRSDEETKRNITEWRFVVNGFVNKDVAAQQQPDLFKSFRMSLAELGFITGFETIELERVEESNRRRKSKNKPPAGSYLFEVHFFASENGEVNTDAIR